MAAHLDLHRDAFVHFLHVGNNRHLAALSLQTVEGVHGQLQRLGVEAAEAFVDEQRFDTQRAGGHRGQPQGQGQRHQEGFPARQRVHRTQFVTHLGVQHQQAEGAAAALEAVAAGQLAQLGVGVVQQQVEVVALGDLAEHIARGRTDQGVQASPALPLLMGLLDFRRQRLVRLLATLVIGLLCTQFGALLLVAGQAFAQLGQGLFQRVGRGVHGHLRSMLLQALFTFLQQHAALFDGFFRPLQALAQFIDLRVIHAQQAIQAGVVQFRVFTAPLGDLALQLLALGIQRLLLLGVGLEFAGQLHALGAQVLQALGSVGVEGAGLLQRGVHVLLPGFGAVVLAQQFAERSLGLLALFVEGGKCVLQLLQGLNASLLLVTQFVQLGLAGLLFFLFVLALLELLQALGNLLVQSEEGIGRVVVQGLEGLFGQHPGQVVKALLQLLLVAGQGLVLLLQVTLGLLLRLLGSLQSLVETGCIFLQGEQGALAFLILADFFVQASQLAVEPGTAGLVVLRGQGRPQAVCLHLGYQRLQLFAQLLLLLLEVLELGVDHAQLSAQLNQLAVEGFDLLLRGIFLGLVMATQALQQRFWLVKRVLGAATHRAGFAIAQLAAQLFDAGIACQALAFQQLAGEVERLLGGLQLGLGGGAFGNQLLALLHGLLLTHAHGLQLLAQFQFAAMQA